MANDLVQLFLAQARVSAHRTALREKRGGRWVPTSWTEWSERSHAIAAALVEVGVVAGDRVAILSKTRKAWVEADLGALLAGAVTVPIYPSVPAEQAMYIVADSGAKVAFVEDPLQLEKLVGDDAWSNLSHLVVFDERASHDDPVADARRTVHVLEVGSQARDRTTMLEDFVERGRAALERRRGELDERAAGVAPDDLATVLYTSGTSGPPKGVMLTHQNFVAEIDALSQRMKLGPSDEQLLFLPLAHVFGRILELASLKVGCTTSFAQSVTRVVDDLGEVRPTFFGSVPRLFERIAQTGAARARQRGALYERGFAWGFDVGREVAALRRRGSRVPLALELQHRYADKLVLSQVRDLFGERLRFALSGGAPLPRELGEWYEAAGVTILEGYGLTETTSATHVSTEDCYEHGRVGRALPGVETRIEDDGEILVRGPNVMKGYWRRPEATCQVIDSDGWFHTGDIGEVDERGMLRITDRKKDLIVTSGGKNVSPQNVEARLARGPLVSQAVVYGDGKPHVVALVTIDEVAAGAWAKAHDRSPVLASLAHDRDFRREVEAEVALANQGLARFESVRAFAILERSFDEALGEVTPTLKVRRRAIYEQHRDVFEALYPSEVG